MGKCAISRVAKTKTKEKNRVRGLSLLVHFSNTRMISQVYTHVKTHQTDAVNTCSLLHVIYTSIKLFFKKLIGKWGSKKMQEKEHGTGWKRKTNSDIIDF